MILTARLILKLIYTNNQMNYRASESNDELV